MGDPPFMESPICYMCFHMLGILPGLPAIWRLCILGDHPSHCVAYTVTNPGNRGPLGDPWGTLGDPPTAPGDGDVIAQ